MSAGALTDIQQSSGLSAAGGGADPVSAIANAIGSIFGTFTQISSQTQSEQQGLDALLLASAPQRPKKEESNMELYFFIGILVLLFLVIAIKFLL